MSAAAEVHAVLILLAQDRLLLPNVAVSEIRGTDGLQPAAAGPDWLLGYLEHGGQRIPAISLERLAGRPAELDLRRSRLVVLKLPSPQADLPAIAVVAQGHPHLATLRRGALQADALHQGDRPELMLARVRLGNQSAWIPDFDAIAGALAAAPGRA